MAGGGEAFSSSGHFREELGRRTLQINDLHEELADAKDRVLEAEDRAVELQQKVARLEAEIAVRKVKGCELDHQADMEEAAGAESRRRKAAAVEDHNSEVAQIRQEISQARSNQSQAEAAAQRAKSQSDEKEGEAGALRARIEALRRDAEQQREDFAKDELAEEARQSRLAVLEREKGEDQIREAKASLVSAGSEVTAAQNEVMRLEAALAMEMECSTGLEAALKHTVQRHEIAIRQCAALNQEVEAKEAMDVEGGIRKALEGCKFKCRELTQELANTKSESLMQTQTLQGAVEETRRMLADHLDQTARHMEETQRCPEASPLADLVSMLTDARGRADQIAERKSRLEAEKSRLEREIKQDEAALLAEKQRAVQQRVDKAEQQLNTGRQALESSSRLAGSAQETLRRAEDSVEEAERAAKQREVLLRGKLEELWRALRQAHAARGYG